MQINPDTLESLRLPHETRTSWAEEVFAMREAVDLSSAIDEGEETLSDFIEWRDGDPYCTRHHAPGKASDQVGVPTPKGIVSTDFQDSLSAGDTQRAALIHLSRLINDHLEKQVSPTVSPQSLQFSLPLQNLRGILWVQLARFVSELDGAAEWRQCLCCPRRIPIHPVHGKRPDTKTCSDRCRKRKERGNY